MSSIEREQIYKKTEHIIEFDKTKELWISLAGTPNAKKKIEEITPSLNERELLVWQRETSEARRMIDKCGNPPVISFEEIADILSSAEKESCLMATQLEYIGGCLTEIRRLKDYLNRGKMHEISLAYYEENLNALDDLRESISKMIRGGRVDDYASEKLLTIRRAIEEEKDKMHNKAERIIRSNKTYLTDSFTTMRNGHICIPVKAEYKHKISGTVMDKSSSGNTVFIEPTVVYSHYENVQSLLIDEENEEMRIRYELTAMVLDESEAFIQNISTVEKLDFIFSKGKLSIEYMGIEPKINTDRVIRLVNARHPLMDKEKCVPLNFNIGDDIQGIIITGPNTGGKTVTIKTVALCSIMAQCGLHVPCEEADICMNSKYLCDIGDGQNLSENLSTFSAHLKNIMSILENVDAESLVIMDELGSGTDPTEGMGIAIAVLEELNKSGATFLVTTHYPEVKNYSNGKSNIINARMDFDKENLAPLYRLIIGEAGESCAFAIAKKMGMSDRMLEVAAKAAYGDGSVERREKNGVISDTIDIKEETSYNNKVNKTKSKIVKNKERKILDNDNGMKYNIGDSVMVYPDKKIGIVCETANEKGILRVQMPNKKIWINHKRVKLHVAASQLYPEDYDFSIIFESVKNRKIKHDMSRKFVEDVIIEE